jgi:tetratricopeptide (TPR) repeat protein
VTILTDEQKKNGYFSQLISGIGLFQYFRVEREFKTALKYWKRESARLERTDTVRLERAFIAYRSFLEDMKPWSLIKKSNFLLIKGFKNWAWIYYDLGVDLYEIGLCENKSVWLEEAVAAYIQAIEGFRCVNDPLSIAKVQASLSGALLEIGSRKDNDGYIEQAFKTAHAALDGLTRKQAPREWGVAQNNLGEVLESLGRLDDAAEAYRQALKEFTPRKDKLHNIEVTCNLSRVFAKLSGGGKVGST